MNHEPHERVLYAEEVFAIQGAIFDVNREMGAGFLEADLRQTYVPDFVCFDRTIIELMAARELAPEHRAQVINYLKATGLRLGLLVNFGCTPKARIERLVL